MFKGLGFAEIASLLKDSHRIPEVMRRIQERLTAEVVLAEVGGGVVQIELNGLGDVRQVRIAPALFVGNDSAAAERLMQEAMNVAKSLVMRRMIEVTRRTVQESVCRSPDLKNCLRRCRTRTG